MKLPKAYVAVGGIVGAGAMLLVAGMWITRHRDLDPVPTRPTFSFHEIGPSFHFRPTITNVQVVDFYGKGKKTDILVCDAQLNGVLLYEPASDGGWQESVLAEELLAPAHATLIDIDQDGDNDVVVSVMGNLHPDDGVIGSVVLLEQANGTFTRRTLLDDVRRVVDVQPADFDRDGDIDLAVAVFGYLRGQVLWLEQLPDGSFRDHELHSAPGTIHVPVADFDQDGDDDIAAVVSQEEEEVWIFENTSSGTFRKTKIFQTINYDLGSAGLVSSDLDRDGDVDLLLPVGDNLEDRYSHAQPYHGCLWLENQGSLKFETHRICQFPGTYAADVADLDGDSDNDIVLVSMTNDWDSPDGQSIVWLENDGQQSFVKHAVANRPIQLVTVACGDINDDGRNDIVAGGLHVFRPYDRLGRVSSWLNVAESTNPTLSESAAADAPTTLDPGSLHVPIPNSLNSEDAHTRDAILAMKSNLEQAVSQNADDFNSWMDLGNVYFAYGFFDSAVTCYQECIRKDAKSPDAKLHCGIAFGRLGKLNKARDILTDATATASGPITAACWHELGRCCLRLELTDEAATAFTRAGNNPWSLYERAKLLVRSEQPESAIPILDDLGKLHPVAIEYFMLRANAAEAMGDSAEATRLRAMAEYNSRRLPVDSFITKMETVHENVGLARNNKKSFELIRDQQWDAACDALQASLNIGWNQQATLLLASAELKRGNAQEAIRVLEEVMSQCGQFPEAMLLLGDGFLMAAKEEKAKAVWEKAVAMREGIGLHQRLAKLHEQQGRESEMHKHQAKMLQAQGVADLRNSKISLAAKSFEKALAIDDGLSTSWFYLGECRRLRGQVDQALTAYRRCLEIDTGHGRSFAALRGLTTN